MPKLGGPGKRKKRCVERTCLKPTTTDCGGAGGDKALTDITNISDGMYCVVTGWCLII